MKTFINENTLFEVGSLEETVPGNRSPSKTPLFSRKNIKGIQFLLIGVTVLFRNY